MTETAEQAAEAPDVESTTEPGTANKEAAKYRRQLREAEAERDALRVQLEQAQASILSASSQIKPEALKAAGHNISDFFVDGALDASKLAQAETHTREILGISRPSAAPALENANRVNLTRQSDWQDAFTPKNRRS